MLCNLVLCAACTKYPIRQTAFYTLQSVEIQPGYFVPSQMRVHHAHTHTKTCVRTINAFGTSLPEPRVQPKNVHRKRFGRLHLAGVAPVILFRFASLHMRCHYSERVPRETHTQHFAQNFVCVCAIKACVYVFVCTIHRVNVRAACANILSRKLLNERGNAWRFCHNNMCVPYREFRTPPHSGARAHLRACV